VIHESAEPLRISKADFDAYVADQLRREPYGPVAYDVLMFGSPRRIRGREYVVELEPQPTPAV
jgi:hypothetical protein